MKSLGWIATSFLMALSLAGCQTSSTSTSEGKDFSLSDPLSSFAPQRDENGFAFPHISTSQSEKTFNFSSVPGQSALEGASIETLALRNRPMEQYMQRVGARLLRHWTGQEPERVGIFLSPQDGLNGQATPFGDIFISILAVEKTESEDELAAIIAHEMGHILLGHHKDAKVVRAMTDAGSVAAQAYTYAAVISRMESRKVGKGSYQYYLPGSQQAAVQNDVFNSAATLMTGITLVKDVGLAQFDRSQEHKADAFAVEMLIKAGYDPTAMADVLEHIRTAEAAAERQRLDRNTQKSKIKSFDFGSVSDVMLNGVSGAVSELAQKVKQTHPPAKSRLDRVNKQAALLLGDSIPKAREVKRHKAAKASSSFRTLASFYERLHQYIADAENESSLRKLATMLKSGFGRTAMARTMAYMTLRSWNSELAYNLLKSASNTQSAPIGYYYMLATAHAQRKKGPEAKQVIAQMQRRFPIETTYPTAISTARTLGDEAWLQANVEQCKAQGNKEVRKLCKEAEQGIRADERFRSSDGLIGALAKTGESENRSLTPDALNIETFGKWLNL